MRVATSRQKKALSGVPSKVRKEVIARLEPQMERYIESGAADEFDLSFKGKYLYVAAKSYCGRRSQRTLLCRLRYTGKPESWGFEIYQYSTSDFDSDGEYPFSGGSVEKCFAVACDLYLWDYDPFEAGSSYDPKARPREPGAIVGPADVLPRLRAGERAPCPELPADLRHAVGGPLLADFSAFVRFIAGRTFKLGARTNGFGRADLAEANALMTQPLALNPRSVLPKVPRVHLCFRVAEALGLLDVDTRKHRAAGHPEAAAFADLPELERWWAILEAFWQRVQWKSLSTSFAGDADNLQAYRASLGEKLAAPGPHGLEELFFSGDLCTSILIPSWCDTGLIRLKPGQSSGRLKDLRDVLARFEVTPLGRWAFARLAEQSPRCDEDDEELELSYDFEGDDFEDDDFE
ncbi:MAG: hypothetical protein ACOX6T_19025 [Myxococcales bacterium]|jgi:hypothetical protein